MGALPRNFPPPTCTRIQDTREAISGGVLDTDSIYVLHGCRLEHKSFRDVHFQNQEQQSNRGHPEILSSGVPTLSLETS